MIIGVICRKNNGPIRNPVLKIIGGSRNMKKNSGSNDNNAAKSSLYVCASSSLLFALAAAFAKLFPNKI